MKTIRLLNVFCIVGILISILDIRKAEFSVEASNEKDYYPLALGPFLQDWSNPDLIVYNNDWSGVPSIEGFRGDDLTNGYDTDPQTILVPNIPGKIHVNASIASSPSSYTAFGVTEFDYFLQTIAIGASNTADAPYIKIYLNSSTCSNIRIKYNVKDIEDSADDAVQQVALHYRSSESGNFINVPSAYIEDATSGPGLATKVTPVDITLPPEANDHSNLEIRIMTTNADGNDEWIGIDDIEISGTCVDPYAEPIIPDCPEKVTIYEGDSISEYISASDLDGRVIQAEIIDDSILGIELKDIQPAQEKGLTLTGQLLIGDHTPGGNHEVQVQFTNNDPIPQTASCTIPIHVIPQSCSQTDTHQIGEIQGVGSSTPIESLSKITTSGIVTATFFEGGINGFFIQDVDGDENELTSDAIFISSINDSLEVGQPVQITGTVSENFGRTQLNNISHIEICGNPETPVPVPVTLPINDLLDFEKLENMLVTFPGELLIIENNDFDRYGEIVLSSQRHINPTSLFTPGSAEFEEIKNSYLLDRIILDDGRLTQNSDPALHPNGEIFTKENFFRCGDTLSNITGILDYAFGNYRIQPTKAADYINTNSRPTKPENVDGNIKVASFNVLNYFTTLNSRGATNEEEFTRQRNKILAAILKTNADIFGLMEIENNTTAIENLVDGLNTAIGNETYSFIDTGIIGVDEIKVAIIYKPKTVTPIGTFAILDTLVDDRFLDEKNRPVLAQTFVDSAFEKKFTVVVNHLKSRSSACDDVADFDLNDGAGNCNLTRTAAAQAIVDWLESDPTNSGNHNYLIIGDLNSYTKEDPIQVILSGADDQFGTIDDFTDLIDEFMGNDAYTYVYKGQVGYLDHALASKFLSQRATGTSIWHINADEADLIDYRLAFKQPDQQLIYSPDEFRASDHDPVIIGLDFSIDNPPIALSKVVDTGFEDETLEFIIDAIDEFNRDLTFRIVSGPTNGELQLIDNVITFTPNPNFFGTDTFVFVANNRIEDSNQATIILDIQPVNDGPVAQNDSYGIEQNQILEVAAPGVLENDSDVEIDPLIAVLVSSPNNGRLILNQDGSFSFEPAKNFHGELEFSYKAYDGQEYSASAIVKIKVKPFELSPDHIIFLPFILR